MTTTSSAHSGADKDGGAAAPAPVVSPYLKWSVIIMGVMLVAGLIIVFSTIIYRAVKMSRDSAETGRAAPPVLSVDIAKGARFERMTMDGGRLAVFLKSDSGQEILIIDTRRGRLVRRIELMPR